MTYDVLGPGGLDYLQCRYGTSKLNFRGPQRQLAEPYVTFLGGTQTFGKYIAQPYPLRVEHLTGVTSVNLGQINAGLDVFSADPDILRLSQGARATVVEILGAANMSNMFYTVHPRRNDRFLSATEFLTRLYPEVDFTQYSFTRHMISDLAGVDPERFLQVRRMLQRGWVRKMQQLLPRLGANIILVRFREEAAEGFDPKSDKAGPLFVTDAMLEKVSPLVQGRVDVPTTPSGEATSRDGLVFNTLAEAAASAVACPQAHDRAAKALQPLLDELM